MSDSGSGSEVEEEYEVEAIINDRSEGNEIFQSKSFESGISSMPDLFQQIILALCFVGIFLLIANKFVKATELDEET